jgi:hypothetical protein
VRRVDDGIQTQPWGHSYIPDILLGVAVILDPEPTPTCRGVPGTAIRGVEELTLTASASSSAFLADLQASQLRMNK